MNFLFNYHISLLSDSNNKTKLPFTVFGMTQQGLSHESTSIGNQDAGCVYIGNNLIVGAVADGCTSGKNLDGMSSNQVGAHIMSYLAIRVARKLIFKQQVKADNFSTIFQQAFINHLRKILNSINPWKSEKSYIISNLLSSTLLVYVVTQDRYIILSCGDGDVYINGIKCDSNHAEGAYFANNLYDLKFDHKKDYLIDPAYRFNCLQIGSTDTLNSILIATDGFIDSDIEEEISLSNSFFNNGTPNLKNGFVDRKREFRANFLERVSESKSGKLWPLDDATFISLNRVK